MTADSGASHPQTTAPPPVKRHAVEFWLVRGGIVLLVLLVGVQAHARFGYEMTLKKLQARIAKEEETAAPLLLSEAKGLIVGFPSQTEDTDRHWKRVTYSWRGLTESYRISMPYDGSETDPAVMSLETADAPPLPEIATTEGDTPGPQPVPAMAGPGMGGPGMGGPGMGGPGMGGPGMGGPRPDPMANDKDGDGKLSKDEAQGRMAENFAEWDANSDGFVDKDEIEAARARFRQRRGGGGAGGGENRPQRPAAETDQPKDNPGNTEKTSEPAVKEGDAPSNS